MVPSMIVRVSALNDIHRPDCSLQCGPSFSLLGWLSHWNFNWKRRRPIVDTCGNDDHGQKTTNNKDVRGG